MKRLLFVCTGNYYRSRFAEAVFNHAAEARRLGWVAFSRGLAIHLVDGDLSHHTVSALEVRSIPRHHTGPTRVQLAETDLAAADRVVVLDRTEHYPMMGRQFAGWVDRVDYWAVADIPFRRPDEALREIERLVFALITSLEDQSPG